MEALSDDHINFYPGQQKTPSVQSPTKSIPQVINPVEPAEKRYSHGLEAIYALETIDVRTIKPLGSTQDAESEKEPEIAPLYTLPVISEKELPLEDKFRSEIEPLHLNEPLYLFDFSKECLRSLYSMNILLLKDLGQITYPRLLAKGIHEKYAEEIINKVPDEKKATDRTRSVDFGSWIRSLIPEKDQASFYLLLKKYELAHLFKISSMVNIEIKRMNSQDIPRLINDAILGLHTGEKKELTNSNIRLIAETFIIPWMRGRLGVATRYEIMDRLEQIGINPYEFHKMIRFITETYAKNSFLFRGFIPEIGEGLYCVSRHVYDEFIAVEKAGAEYFYSPGVAYYLDELIDRLSRESAKKWKIFSPEFIEKVLRTSKKFSLQKNSDHQIIVRFR